MGRENYYLDELLRDEGFWMVFKARSKVTGQTVEMKVVLKDGPVKLKDYYQLQKEVEKHKKLKHKNIAGMMDCFENEEEFCIVTELPQAKRLSEIIKDRKPLPADNVQPLAKQLVRAMCYLHSNGITYHNLMPQDIFIYEGPVIKVCGFGSARFMSLIGLSTLVIRENPLYMAPEILRNQPYKAAADLWSLGVILYELFLGRQPFCAKNVYTLMEDLIKGPIIIYPDNMTSDFRTFISGLLIEEPKERLSWAQVPEQPFVKETLEELIKTKVMTIGRVFFPVILVSVLFFLFFGKEEQHPP